MSAEVAEKSIRRGRPSGKAQVGREAGLRLHDLSFARAVVQGLVPVTAAQRYLPESLADERVASAHLRRVLQIAADILGGIEEVTAARALSEYPGFTKSQANSITCETPTVAQPKQATPSLDEFAEEIGAEDFSEREIQELYQERYGEQLAAMPAPAAAPAAGVEPDAVLRALSIVQSRGVVLPKPTDPARLWFSQNLVNRLADVQIVLLQDMVQYVNRHGRHWYRLVPGVGQDRARRLVGWLVQHEPFLDQKIAPRSRWDGEGACDQNGMENHMVCFSIPSCGPSSGPLAALDGVLALTGTNPMGGASLRSTGPNALGVQSDLDAVKAWLDTLSFKSPHTRTAYARDAQRLLFWAHEQGKTLSTLTVTDAAEHARFLVDPPAHWLCELPTRRSDAAWRPMRGPLSAASAARALAAIGHLYGFLVETGFLVANPFSRIRRSSVRRRAPQIDTTRSFRSYHLQMLVSVVQAMAAGPARRRARALLMLMMSTGVRISELGGTWGDVVSARSDWEEGEEGGRAQEAQCLRVIGKGGKERLLPLKPSVLKMLQKHLEDRRALEQQGVLPALELSKTPLISVVAKPVGPDLAKDNGGLSVAGIHRVIKSLCERAARGCGDARLAAEFRAASAHWMRHTFAHAVLRASGGDLPVTQQLLGHASISTTGIYVKADMGQRLKAVMALPLMFDSGGLVRR